MVNIPVPWILWVQISPKFRTTLVDTPKEVECLPWAPLSSEFPGDFSLKKKNGGTNVMRYGKKVKLVGG